MAPVNRNKKQMYFIKSNMTLSNDRVVLIKEFRHFQIAPFRAVICNYANGLFCGSLITVIIPFSGSIIRQVSDISTMATGIFLSALTVLPFATKNFRF
jgi:hypothetical protein